MKQRNRFKNRKKKTDPVLNRDVQNKSTQPAQTWWRRHQNNVWGGITLLALLLSILFYFYPYDNKKQNLTAQKLRKRITRLLDSLEEKNSKGFFDEQVRLEHYKDVSDDKILKDSNDINYYINKIENNKP